MNFKVIDGDYVDYEIFKLYYLDPECSKEFTLKMLNIGKKKYDKMAEEVREKTGLKRWKGSIIPVTGNEKQRKKKVRVPKNYYYSQGHKGFIISKVIDGKRKYFGYVKTEKEAQEIVDWLREHNWDEESLKDFKGE